MKKLMFALLAIIVCSSIGTKAQNHAQWNDNIHIGADYGFDIGNGYDADYNAIALRAGYQKFLYRGLFVLPELSLLYQHYKSDDSGYVGGHFNSTKSYKNFYLNRFGAGLDALLGVRVLYAETVGIDLMAGPYIEYLFVNNEKPIFGWVNSDRKFEFRWRFGLGFSILRKATIRATYDLSSSDNFSDRGDVMTVGVAYTF